MINFWTKAPEPTQIQLWVGGGQPGEKGTTEYGTYSTNADGTFDVKSNAQWNGTEYKLVFIPNDGSGYFTKDYSLNKHQTLNVGDLFAGTVVIGFCQTHLNSVSGASINLTQFGSVSNTTFSAGTHTVLTAQFPILQNGNAPIPFPCQFKYRLSTSTTDSTIIVPLHPPADTTSITINY